VRPGGWEQTLQTIKRFRLFGFKFFPEGNGLSFGWHRGFRKGKNAGKFGKEMNVRIVETAQFVLKAMEKQARHSNGFSNLFSGCNEVGVNH